MFLSNHQDADATIIDLNDTEETEKNISVVAKDAVSTIHEFVWKLAKEVKIVSDNVGMEVKTKTIREIIESEIGLIVHCIVKEDQWIWAASNAVGDKVTDAKIINLLNKDAMIQMIDSIAIELAIDPCDVEYMFFRYLTKHFAEGAKLEKQAMEDPYQEKEKEILMKKKKT